MVLTGAQLQDEVIALTGRTGDTVLVDSTRVARWLSEAQNEIVEKIPDLLCMAFNEDCTSWQCVSDSINYNLSDITAGDNTTQTVAFLTNIYYFDGNESVKLKYIHADEFDLEYPDPTHSDNAPDKPVAWTRRKNIVKIVPNTSSTYASDASTYFQLRGVMYAADLTTNTASTSQITNSDEGLIAYAVAKAWRAIGDTESLVKQKSWERDFDMWLSEFKEKNDQLQEWDGNLYGEID